MSAVQVKVKQEPGGHYEGEELLGQMSVVEEWRATPSPVKLPAALRFKHRSGPAKNLGLRAPSSSEVQREPGELLEPHEPFSGRRDAGVATEITMRDMTCISDQLEKAEYGASKYLKLSRRECVERLAAIEHSHLLQFRIDLLQMQNARLKDHMWNKGTTSANETSPDYPDSEALPVQYRQHVIPIASESPDSGIKTSKDDMNGRDRTASRSNSGSSFSESSGGGRPSSTSENSRKRPRSTPTGPTREEYAQLKSKVRIYEKYIELLATEIPSESAGQNATDPESASMSHTPVGKIRALLDDVKKFKNSHEELKTKWMSTEEEQQRLGVLVPKVEQTLREKARKIEELQQSLLVANSTVNSLKLKLLLVAAANNYNTNSEDGNKAGGSDAQQVDSNPKA